MRAFVALVLILLVIAAVATGIIYFTSDRNRASMHFDKQRAGEMIHDVQEAGEDAAQRLDDAVRGDRSQPAPASPGKP